MMSFDEGDDSKKCYKRLHRWRYSPTAAYGNNEVHLHPYKARRLSVAETLAIQSLPREFVPPSDISLSAKFKTIGNVRGYCDAQGNVVASYTYDAFGNTIAQSGPMADDFTLRFSTKYFDCEVNLYYYGYRYFRPSLMRWLNRDPVGEEGGVNLYAFCGNSALSLYDKDGRAYFAYRPLGIFPFRWFVLGTHQDELDNTVIAHEQLFFEDNRTPSNLGFFDDSQVRVDTAGIPYRRAHSTRWDDCIMRKAVKMVKPRNYKLLDFNLHNRGTQYNCQDWADDVRWAYYCITHNIHYYPQGTTFIGAGP